MPLLPKKPAATPDDPYASIAQPIAQVQTGTVGGHAPATGNPEGVSNPPNQGQVLNTSSAEPNDPYAGLASDIPAPSEERYSNQLMKGIPGAAKSVGKGLLEGAGSTLNNIRQLGLGPKGTPEQEQRMQSLLTPSDAGQSFGKGLEQAGEFLIPGMGEEKAASLLPDVRYAKPLGRIAYNALTSGAVNKAQGGDFGTGAEVGATGSLLGQGLQSLAPHAAESSLNIRKLDRAYGKGGGEIGRTVLDQTTGLRPGKVADSAQRKLDVLNPQLNELADKASIPEPTIQRLKSVVGLNPGNDIASMNPGRKVLQDAGETAERQGERTTTAQLQPMIQHLGETISGKPIPENVTPRQLLDLNRGFGNEFIHRWNPETMEGVKGTAAQTYHAMRQEFNNAVPGAAEKSALISRLIPISKRGESAELNAPTMQRAFNRIGAHSGAAVGGLLGGYQGYQHGGLPSAIGGAALGIAAPELTASPTGEMVMARTMNKAGALRPLQGAILNVPRYGSKQD